MHHGKVTPEIAAGLLALKARIAAAKIPASKLDETVNVAVWNVREFGRVRRTEAAVHYIAEIIGQFDLVALVELRDDLTDLGRVMTFLGDSWKVIFSDWQEDDGANNERVAFLFDRRAVIHQGLAAEVDAPRTRQTREWLATQSFWRAPYLCAFRAGNFDFLAIATHARWGDSLPARQAELQLLSDWIKQRFASKFVEDHDLIVLGDFNTPKLNDALFEALTSAGLRIPKPLVQLKAGDRVIGGSNLPGNARYDQILHLPTVPENFTNAGGVLDFFHRRCAHRGVVSRQEIYAGEVYPTDVGSLAGVDRGEDGYRGVSAGPDHPGGEGVGGVFGKRIGKTIGMGMGMGKLSPARPELNGGRVLVSVPHPSRGVQFTRKAHPRARG